MGTYLVSFKIDIKSHKINTDSPSNEFIIIDKNTKKILSDSGIPNNVLKKLDGFASKGFNDKIWPTRSYMVEKLTNTEANKLIKIVSTKEFGGKNIIKERERVLRKDFKELTLGDIRRFFIKNNEFKPIPMVETGENVPDTYITNLIFIPNGNAIIGPERKLVEGWLSSKETQKNGQFIYLTGMMSNRKKNYPAGEYFIKGDMQVCDGNLVSSNCLNSKSFINKKLLK